MALSSAVAALLKPQAERGRNSFPLDNKQVYSMKAGQITPIKALHFMPGDYFNMRVADFALTFPMQTAPFLRGRKEFAFYSVYYNAIWSLFNQAQATRQDPKTSAFGDIPTFTEPRIGLSQLYFACFEQFVYYIYDKYTFVGDGAIVKALHTTWLRSQKGSFLDVDTTNSFTPDGDIVSSMNYDTINTVVDFYHRQEDEVVNEDYIYDVVGQYRVYNWIRKLDMLGYGNIYPLFNECERNIIDANYDYTRTNGQLNNTTTEGLWSLFKTLWDALYDASVNRSTKVSKKVNLYSLCAYNSVFYHFFRNSYYDLDYNPRNYSLDFASVQGGNNTIYMADLPLRFLDIEYHQWKKDMFTGVLPDTQFGAVSSVEINMSSSVNITGVTGYDNGNWTTSTGSSIPLSSSANVATAENRLYNVNTNDYIRHYHSLSGTASLNNTSFDVIALKRAEMLQDYRQQLMRAGNKTSDVFRAIYGGSPSSEHEDDVIPRFMDTFGIDIFVDPVTATADTNQGSNGSLGDIAARGKFKGESREIKFNSGNNFGVILALAYVVPTAEYNSYMLDKHNLELTPEDHFIPQFENLGLEPIYTDELNSLLPVTSMQVLGYAPRYHHKKCQVDQIHGAFCSLFIKSASISSNRHYDVKWYGDFNHWVSPRTDMQSRRYTNVRDFYINPNVLDNVFVQAAGADLSQDQFICNTYFQIASTRAMSKVGLINFV